MKTIQTKTVVFLTGAFVSSDCWSEWKNYFEINGYQVHAPAWPFKDAPACTLRQRHPDSDVASLRLNQLTDHYRTFVRSLPGKPILIGHSMGGLIVQLLIQEDLAEAGVAIHSLQPQGVFTFKFSFFKAGWPALGYFTDPRKTYLMTFRQWQYAFTNGMPLEIQKDSYYKLLVPESKRIVRDATTSAAKVNFSKPHVPLLFIAGSEDHFIPPSLNYKNFKKYSHIGSARAYKEFSGRNHFVLGQHGWDEIATYIKSWLNDIRISN